MFNKKLNKNALKYLLLRLKFLFNLKMKNKILNIAFIIIKFIEIGWAEFLISFQITHFLI